MGFQKGNKLATGGPRPGAGRKPGLARELACSALDAISGADLNAIVRTLVRMAKGGDIRAAGLIFDRLLGKPASADIAEVEGALREEALKFQQAVVGVLSEEQRAAVLEKLKGADE